MRSVRHFFRPPSPSATEEKPADLSVSKAPRSRHRLKSRVAPMLVMVSPVTLWLIFLIALPLAYVLFISFCTTDASHNIVVRFSLDNYAQLFDPLYLGIYANSLFIAAISTVVCILLGYPFAYSMASAGRVRKTVMMMLLMLPFWTNSLIRIYGWRTILGTSGVLNSVLKGIGLIQKPLEILYTPSAIILGMVYTLFPFMVLPIFTSIDKLDRTLLEAASDLGAKRWRAFLHITLPLTASGIFAGTIMVFIPVLGFFFVADLMGGGTQQMIGNLIERQFKEAYNWPLGAALSIILIVLTIVMVRIYTRNNGDMKNLV
jgi:spermidine/putrescine transport system permease protein